MKKVIRLTESELSKLIQRIVSETTQSISGISSPKTSLGGPGDTVKIKDQKGSDRSTKINQDGTISITSDSGQTKKVRLSTAIGDINVVKIEPTSGGYNITGKSGRTEKVDNSKIHQIINFVDSKSTTGEVDSGSFVKPDIQMKKVQ